MSRRRRNETEEQRARRELISDFLSAANIQSMQNGTPYFWLGEFCEKHDLPFYGLHSFRHLFASLLVNQGVDKRYGKKKLEDVCERMLTFSSNPSIRTITTLLKKQQRARQR